MGNMIIYLDGSMIHHQICAFGLSLDDLALEILELVTSGGVQVGHRRTSYPFTCYDELYYDELEPLPVDHPKKRSF